VELLTKAGTTPGSHHFGKYYLDDCAQIEYRQPHGTCSGPSYELLMNRFGWKGRGINDLAEQKNTERQQMTGKAPLRLKNRCWLVNWNRLIMVRVDDFSSGISDWWPINFRMKF